MTKDQRRIKELFLKHGIAKVEFGEKGVISVEARRPILELIRKVWPDCTLQAHGFAQYTDEHPMVEEYWATFLPGPICLISEV